jgi:hypothetical protein
MQTRSRTRLAFSPEPDPLAMAPRQTASVLHPEIETLLSTIDGILQQSPIYPLDLVAAATEHRTRLRDEPTPLGVPKGLPAPVSPVSERSQPRRAAHLLRCLKDVQGWLGLSLGDACRAAGINRATVYAWRDRDSDPRPGTVGSVLRLHGLVASAVAGAGEEQVRAWFHTGDPSPISRLIAAHGDQTTLATVGRELRRSLTGPTPPPPNPLLAATVDDNPARPLA